MTVKKTILLAVVSLLFLAISSTIYTALTIAAAIAHEIGHIVAIFLTRSGMKRVKLTPLGAEIQMSRKLHSYKKSMVIALSGAITNFLLFFVFVNISEPGSYGHFFAWSNMILACLNLFPIASLDGGEALSALLHMRLDPQRAYKIEQHVSLVFLIVLWVLAVYLLFVTSRNFTMFMICLYLFARIHLSRLPQYDCESRRRQDRRPTRSYARRLTVPGSVKRRC